MPVSMDEPQDESPDPLTDAPDEPPRAEPDSAPPAGTRPDTPEEAPAFEPEEPEHEDEPLFEPEPPREDYSPAAPFVPTEPPRPAPPVQVSQPRHWPPAETPAPIGPPLGRRPRPDLAPIAPPAPSARPRRSWTRRIMVWLLKGLLIFVVGSVLWVTAYRFIAPPITLTMIGDMLSGHTVTRSWMPIDRIDPDMARAVIAGEDARFCEHGGFDYKAMAAAAARNAKGGRIRGGSTISQQTAKNVFLWQGGGYFRKGLEAWFTLLIETIWGKRRIMEVYLNVAETGIGTYGVDAGAQRYFGHDASRLSPREAAQIAAVLPLPKRRAGVDPRGFTRRYGNAINARASVVRGDGLDRCLR